jgi:hypothetical protein
MNKPAVKTESSPAALEVLNITDVVAQIENIKKLMQTVMVPEEHFGIIPGTKKETLYKAGAEKLAMMFRLIPTFEEEYFDIPYTTKTGVQVSHREYTYKCILNHVSGPKMGEGVGICSTMESKYRFRRDGTENENPADNYNTAKKIGKKRAFVDAVITATSASDIFTQDMEDIVANERAAGVNTAPNTNPTPAVKIPETPNQDKAWLNVRLAKNDPNSDYTPEFYEAIELMAQGVDVNDLRKRWKISRAVAEELKVAVSGYVAGTRPKVELESQPAPDEIPLPDDLPF